MTLFGNAPSRTDRRPEGIVFHEASSEAMDFPLPSNGSNASDSSGDSSHLETVDGVLEGMPLVLDPLDGGWIGKIATSALLLLGTFGNLMTILILRTFRAGWSAMNLYLTALAVSDMAMLYSGTLPMWTRKVMNFDLHVSHVLACKGFIWIMHSSAAWSAWFLVALTVQRAVSVVWPHRVNLVCTHGKSVIVSIVIAVVFSSLYAHTLYGYDIVKVENGTSTRCTFVVQSYQTFWVSVWVKVDIFLFCVFPVTFVTISNAVLLWKLAVSVKEANLTFSGAKVEQKQNRKEKASSTTVTVITVSIAFVLTTVPLMTYNTFVFEQALKDEHSRQFHYFLYELFIIFSMSNFAWNFYLYCLTGTKFRREFMAILFGCCGYKSSTSTSRSTKEGKQSGSMTTLQKKSLEMESNDDF